MNYYTQKEISKHNKLNDCWIILYNKVFNITEFISNEHPGGFIPLSVAGLDATNLFISTHPIYVNKMLNAESDFYLKYYIGSLVSEDVILRNDSTYYKLKLEIENYMKEKKLKARDIVLFDIEIIVFIMTTLITYYMMIMNNSLLYSILHGISFTFMITRTIHDCNHGALTSKNNFKRYLFTFINEIFSSNQSWQSKHNLHHMHTNDLDKDPDLRAPFRLSHKTVAKKQHKYQVVYTFLLYTLFSVANLLGLRYKSETSYEPMHSNYYYLAKTIFCLYIYISYKFKSLLCLLIAQLVCGFYLSITFTVSHNLYYLTDGYRNNNSFLEQQLSSTTDYNVGSKLTNFITHGLNHQTIHHLFPSINYYHYPILTKDILIPFCKKNKLNYNGENKTFLELIYVHIKSLYYWRK